MSRHVSPEAHRQVSQIMLGIFGSDPRERFLTEEIIRYVPELVGEDEAAIAAFFRYHRSVYIDGRMPEIGRPIASLNPMFSDGTGAIGFSDPERRYIRASVKHNGFRLQLHRGNKRQTAFSRQFTPYELRLFPELHRTIVELPLMIGDTELITKHLKHNAALNALQDIRLPGTKVWPKPGCTRLEPSRLKEYLSDPDIFGSDGKPHRHLELMLAFHGLFAISHPKTWNKAGWAQAAHMIPLCKLPIDYALIDELLEQLGDFIKRRNLEASIVEKKVVSGKSELDSYVAEKREQGEEGVCVVQSIRDTAGQLVTAPHAIKIKEYETIDMAVLGLFLADPDKGLIESNVSGAMLGLYDAPHGVYAAATRVSLDPTGVQIKTPGQAERTVALRKEICETIVGRQGTLPAEGSICTLYEMFLMAAEKFLLPYLVKDYPSTAWSFEHVLEDIPRGYDLWKLYQLYQEHKEGFLARTEKCTTQAKQYVHGKLAFFQAIDRLGARELAKFKAYFSVSAEVRERSARLKKPNFLVATDRPVIVETKVFNLKRGTCSYPAGVHSWYPGQSFCFSNNYAERMRHDKNTTTGFETIHLIAGKFEPRPASAARRSKQG